MDNEYFDWLCSLVNAGPDGIMRNYSKLLLRLYNTEFIPDNAYDISRAVDGSLLKYNYGYHKDEYIDYNSCAMASHERYSRDDDYDRCSMLEMMIAFANKIECCYMSNSYEERTALWFWLMIESLALDKYNDWSFDDEATYNPVDDILHHFRYKVATLFRIRDPQYNVHDDSVNLWTQMVRWVSENYDYYAEVDMKSYLENLCNRS